MTTPKVKATYSLDADTVKLLERLASRWDTSKSEALRRVIRAAAVSEPRPNDALAAFERLQASMALTEAEGNAWVRRVRTERRASTKHRGL